MTALIPGPANGRRLQISALAYAHSRQLIVMLDVLGHGTLSLRAGEPVAPDQAADKATSLLYIWFERAIADEDLAALTVASAGWTAKTFKQGDKHCLALAPSVDLVMSADRRQEIVLTGARLDEAAMNVVLLAEHFRIVGEKPNLATVQHFSCSTIGEERHRLNLLVGIESGGVIEAADKPQSLVLAIRNLDETPLVVVGRHPPHRPEGMTLTLEVVAEAAMINPDASVTEDGQSITVSPLHLNANEWSVRQRDEGGRRVFDLVAAPVEGGQHHVLGVGPSGIVTFKVDGVAAKVPGLGYLVLSYSGVPGYGSGRFHLPFHIAPKVAIRSFRIVKPAGGRTPRMSQDVTVAYAVDNAETLTLTGAGDKVINLPPESKEFTLTATETTNLVLTARNRHGHAAIAVATLTMVQPLVIEDFQVAKKTEVRTAESFKVTIELQMAVQGARRLTVTDVLAGAKMQLSGTATSVSFDVTGAAVFQLFAEGHDGASAQAFCHYERTGVPRGTVVAWSPTSGAIPFGWALCDGHNGTPDLRGRFVLAAHPEVDGQKPGQTGGHSAHVHHVSVTGKTGGEGTHKHRISEYFTIKKAKEGSNYNVVDPMLGPSGQDFKDRSEGNFFTADSGFHNHDFAFGVDSRPGNHMPPFFSLCYIMKL